MKNEIPQAPDLSKVFDSDVTFTKKQRDRLIAFFKRKVRQIKTGDCDG